MAEDLQPMTVPLAGSRLMEASAGTGKTWTIAALYARLVAGVACEVRSPPNILVMTFTKAATRELSDRIRQRLSQAANHLREAVSGSDTDRPDPFLDELRDHFPVGQARQNAAWRLAQAAQTMDEAAVHTIDAWCQRVLRDFAFDSGSPFQEALQAHERQIQTQALHDYWRTQVYPLDPQALDVVLSVWNNVQALRLSIQDLLDKPLDDANGALALADLAAQRWRQWQALREGWVQRAQDMHAWMEDIRRQKSHPLRADLPKSHHLAGYIQSLRAWAESEQVASLSMSDSARQKLSGRALRQRIADRGISEVVPSAFDAFDDLMVGLAAWDNTDAMRRHAAAGVAQNMATIKSRAGQFGFADLLTRLDRALDPSRDPDRAQRLRERILERYPVALIDEFQDTSPVQLRIVDRLYRVADNDPSRTLLLIGDPKQAIYKFRGADIYSYLRARRATQGRHEVLGTNYRSTLGMVQAVNAVFEHAESHLQGAFLYGGDGQDSQLPFRPVRAQGRPETLLTSSGPLPPMTVLLDEAMRSADEAQRLYAAHCAEAIVNLLNDQAAGFQLPGQALQRLRSADIAVLVRTGREAQAVRRQLQRRGVASVYLSEKQSVFESPEALDLLRLLQAILEPGNIRLARTALATNLMGWTLAQLVHLADDDEAFDRQSERLRHLQAVWLGQGILAMIHRAVLVFEWPIRWAEQGSTGTSVGTSVERRLTNVLHLGELLQAASVQIKGEQALWRWLQQQVFNDDDSAVSSEESQLRLESDAGLVQVVTIHKSKGLEYPVVFVPFATFHREVLGPGRSSKNLVLELPEQPDEPLGADVAGIDSVALAHRVRLSPSPADIETEGQEQLREQVRLLYVALTRARHAVWLGAANLAKLGKNKALVSLWHRSALGHLVSGGVEKSPQQRLADWQALANRTSAIHLVHLPQAEGDVPWPAMSVLHDATPTAPLALQTPYTAGFDRAWAVSSYTRLVKQRLAHTATPTDAVAGTRLREDEPPTDEAPKPEAPSSLAVSGPEAPIPSPWHLFPRGASAGTFLHGLLEWLADVRFRIDDRDDAVSQIQGRCERSEFKDRSDAVVAWMRALCTTTLPPLGASLSQLQTVVPEMEFWFPSDGLQAQELDRLCRAHIFPGQSRQPLNPQALQGMFMGLADLVFEHEGRFWVLDYKSNHLGAGDSHYTAAAMGDAMLAHRYDVQAAIYLLALHRLLRARLGVRYAPEKHLGGALYLFMRGIGAESAGCCHVTVTPSWIDALDALVPTLPASPWAEEGA